MADSKKTGDDLLDDFDDLELNDVGMHSGGTPFDQTVDLLSSISGPRLELFCRSNRALVDAVQICDNIAGRFGSEYIQSRKDQIMRFSVSASGLGRAELVDSLRAGDGVRDSYYEAQAASSMGFTSD